MKYYYSIVTDKTSKSKMYIVYGDESIAYVEFRPGTQATSQLFQISE
jgi:hypothetical protein